METELYTAYEFSAEELVGFCSCIGETYQNAGPEHLSELLAESLGEMSPEEAEDFLKTLASIGQALLPVIGGAVGSIILPGVGAPIGAALGGLAGNAVGSLANPKKKPKPKKRPVKKRKKSRVRSSSAKKKRPSHGNQYATKALLSAIQNPKFLQSLASGLIKALGGSLGAKETVALNTYNGTESVPVSAFMDLISVLASQAAIETAQSSSLNPDISSYLLDESGEARGDIANPEERARILLELLQEDGRVNSYQRDRTNWLDSELVMYEKSSEEEQAVEWLEGSGLVSFY